MKCTFWLFLLFFFVLKSFGQITGTIYNETGTTISGARITIWESESKTELIAYGFSDPQGNFTIKIPLQTKKMFLEVTALNFATNILTYQFSKKPLKIVLEKKEVLLDEVKIINQKAVHISNDTVFYNPAKFLDGTEKKVEDLIDKLPGISVNKISGLIKYKGKEVETVQLGGDDLFGRNYAIGTKNISVDMIDEVQAIENYSSNKILKGIEDTDKVVLNLKLKQNKTDYSGTVALNNGYGDKNMYSDEVTLIGVSDQLKSFGVFRLNNIGSTTKDILDFTEKRTYTISGESLLAKQVFDDSPQKLSLPDMRANFNTSVFGNYNLIYRLSPKLSIKNNLYFINDQLDFYENIQNYYVLTDIKTALVNNFRNKSNYFKMDTQASYYFHDKAQLILNLNLKNVDNERRTTAIQNDEKNYLSKHNTHNYLIFASAEYTTRLTLKSALEWITTFSNNKAPQKFISNPSNLDITGVEANRSRQNSHFQKAFFSSKVNLYANFKKVKNLVTIGYLHSRSPFLSSLEEDGMTNGNFRNNQKYKFVKQFLGIQNSYNYKKIKYSHYLEWSSNQIKLDDFIENTSESQNKMVFRYNGFLEYKLNRYSKVYLNTSFDNKAPNEFYLFKNDILVNNTTVINSLPSLDFIKSTDLTMGYRFDRVLKNYSLDIGINYANYTNRYISRIDVNQNYIAITKFQPNNKSTDISVLINLEKRFKSLKTLFKYNSSFSKSTYNNALQNFEIRKNHSNGFYNSLFFSTFFNFPINLDNKFNYNWMQFISPNQVNNTLQSLSNVFKINYKPNDKITLSTIYDYYLPDFNSNSQFSFLDFSIQYKSGLIKWLTISVYGRNLLNSKTYTRVLTDDYSYEIYEANLNISEFFSKWTKPQNDLTALLLSLFNCNPKRL